MQESFVRHLPAAISDQIQTATSPLRGTITIIVRAPRSLVAASQPTVGEIGIETRLGSAQLFYCAYIIRAAGASEDAELAVWVAAVGDLDGAVALGHGEPDARIMGHDGPVIVRVMLFSGRAGGLRWMRAVALRCSVSALRYGAVTFS